MKNFLYLLALFVIPGLLYSTDISRAINEKKEKCGTIQALIDFENGIERPRPSSGPKYIYTTRFIIHFDTTGSHATTRAFAETTAVHAELSWSGLSALGWIMPPPDGINGGDSRYDIYIRNISYYGVCYPESPYTTPYPDGYSSWVEVDVAMSWGDLRATVIHEFHHGIQMRYSKFEGPLWAFYENTSTFIEDYFYDYVNYLQGVLSSTSNDPLDEPYLPICNNNVDEYAGALWAHFLDEYYDASIDTRPLRRIWELCGMHAGSYLIKDIDSVLRLSYSSDLKKALGHYAIWRAFCGTVNDGRHYIEGSTYGNIAILRSHTTYPASGNEGTSDPIGPGGCNVISLTNFGTNRVTLYFDGQNGYDWSCYVIGFCPDGNSYEYKIPLEATQDTGRITIPGWEFNKIFLIPVVTHWSAVTSGLTHTYNVTLSASDLASHEAIPTNEFDECGFSKRDELRKLGEGRARPTLSGTVQHIVTTNFRVHFTLSGNDATTTAYAESTSVAAEAVWSRFSTLGWYMPPPDGTNGGCARYDIYIRALSGYLGICYDENPYTTPFPDGYTSWVEITRSGITNARLRALVAHEVGHGIQIRYSNFEEPFYWFYENSSVFMEDIVFDDVNTLPDRLTGSTDDPLDNPQYPINRVTGVYEYRGALWTHFLDQYYDPYPARAVRRIWDLCGRHAGNHILKDIDSTLALHYSSNFAKALGHYAIWRYFSGTRDDGRHYEEGSSYPNASLLRSHTTYPASGTQGGSNPSGPGGCNYIGFTGFGNNRVTLYFDGQNGYEWSAYVLGRSGNTSYEYKIFLEPTQDTGRITIPGWEFNEIVLIPVVTHWTSTASNLTYTYNVTISSADKNIADEALASNYVGFFTRPNPSRSQVLINYFLPQNENAVLKIYNTSGQLIKITELSYPSNTFIWNRLDNHNRPVNKGVYLIELTCGNQIKKQKVVLLQ